MAAAVLPAAGFSRRMGGPKLLLPFGHTTIIGAVVETLRAAAVDPIVVVASGDNVRLLEWVRTAGLEAAINPEPEGGMLSSIWSGLERLEELGGVAGAAATVLILPADLPRLSAETVRRVLEVALRHPEALVMPTRDGHNGHPLAVPRSYLGEIRTLDPSVGLKQLRERHDVLTVEVDDAGIAADVDTPADYDRLRRRDG